MNHRWNQAQEGYHMQSHLHRNQYPGTNETFSPTLRADITGSAFTSNSGMSSRNDAPLSTRSQTPLPSFLPQELVWPTTTMTINPPSFYPTSMPGIASQPTFLIPMPAHGCAYPNNNGGYFFSFPPTVTAAQGGGYLIQPPMILPPQPVMVSAETSYSRSAVASSSMLRSSSSNAFPTRFEGKNGTDHSCLSLKSARNSNALKYETNVFEKDDLFLLPQACESSFQSRSANQEPLESPEEEEVQWVATTKSDLCSEDAASIDNEEHSSPKAAAAEVILLNKPRRALSAYNLFFKDQRERMIRRQERKEEEEERQASNSQKGPKKRCRSSGKRRKHGIRFESMARDIAQLWKNVDPHVLSRYEVIAEKDKKRYQYEKEMYMQQRMNVMETTREQLEATVSDLVRQNYLEKAESANSPEGNASKKKRKRVE